MNRGRGTLSWGRDKRGSVAGTTQGRTASNDAGLLFFSYNQPSLEVERFMLRTVYGKRWTQQRRRHCSRAVAKEWTDSCPEEGMLDVENGDETEAGTPRSTRRDVHVRGEEGEKETKKGDHTLACQRNPCVSRIHKRVGDRLALQLRKMGATLDMERTAPQWTTTAQVPLQIQARPNRQNSNDFRWGRAGIARRYNKTLDRPGPQSCFDCGICCGLGRKRQTTMKYGNKKEVGPDTDESASHELWGRRHLRLRAAIEITMVREEADALIVAECVLMRTRLKVGDDVGT